jgi:uncharacterized membrane-anchored protein
VELCACSGYREALVMFSIVLLGAIRDQVQGQVCLSYRGWTLDVAWMVASTEMIVDTSAFCILFKGVSYVMFLSILKTHTRQRQE